MLFYVISIFPVTNVVADDFAKLDYAIPSNSVINGTEPVFDFDGDGCLPSAGISRNGEQNGGLRTSGRITSGCRSSNFLDTSNTLHRYACQEKDGSTFCGHFYSLYFEKDQVVNHFGGGHRHDWEYVAVWTKDGQITHGSYSAHGDLFTREASELPFEGNHIKFVYHKDGATTHAMRFAKANEVAENPYGYFVTPTIVSWYELYGDGIANIDMRNRLNRYDYGSASIPLKDSKFLSNLNEFKPAGYPSFSVSSIESINPNGAEVSVFEHCNYGGYKILLNEGKHTLSELQAIGMSNDDISSVKVPSGYKVELYEHHQFNGKVVKLDGSDISCLNSKSFNDEASSIKVTKK